MGTTVGSGVGVGSTLGVGVGVEVGRVVAVVAAGADGAAVATTVGVELGSGVYGMSVEMAKTCSDGIGFSELELCVFANTATEGTNATTKPNKKYRG